LAHDARLEARDAAAVLAELELLAWPVSDVRVVSSARSSFGCWK
jgi:hypothetical protein